MVLYSYPTVAQASEEDWDRVYAVNTKGTFLVSKEAALRIPPGEGGRIVKITTSLVATLLPNFAVYTSSKAAVETFTKILAKELRGTKITANV
jgi:3-oxoacyl-[acyl-carrier protein] reductase